MSLHIGENARYAVKQRKFDVGLCCVGTIRFIRKGYRCIRGFIELVKMEVPDETSLHFKTETVVSICSLPTNRTCNILSINLKVWKGNH
jgi:hypothetical protein